jgi:hypothetical protein
VSEQSFEEDGLLLSVLIRKNKAGVTRPSDSFFELADKYDDCDKFVEEQGDAASWHV